jgi:hypothetical protein
MSGRFSILLTWTAALALATGFPVASQGQSAPTDIAIRWEHDGTGRTRLVSVERLTTEMVKALEASSLTPEAWAEIFSIRVETTEGQPIDRPAMLGTYQVVANSIQFKPRFPLDLGRTYVATFRPSRIPGGSGTDFVWRHLDEKPVRPATVVARVTPSTDQVPENLLKFYLYFSSPMSRGEVYDRVRLLKPDGEAVQFPFLRVVEELWDPSGTRLTLLIDPGRIKRGLKPREQFGPVLEAGRTYSLVIDAAWLDAEGNPLGTSFRKTFRTGPADEIQPDPKNWAITRPRAASREPLEIRFPESLDRGLIESGLTLLSPAGEEVAGHLEIDLDETRWRFTPDAPWVEGEYVLQVDNEIEDLAGNSIRRPFEVDIQRDVPVQPEARSLRLPIPIRAGAP